jgi:hypothetical protein
VKTYDEKRRRRTNSINDKQTTANAKSGNTQFFHVNIQIKDKVGLPFASTTGADEWISRRLRSTIPMPKQNRLVMDAVSNANGREWNLERLDAYLEDDL